jgi:hypothetical protein
MFVDNSVGKKEMQDHLDMHFRQNRKANQNIGRGHSHSWFVALEVYFMSKTQRCGSINNIHNCTFKACEQWDFTIRIHDQIYLLNL